MTLAAAASAAAAGLLASLHPVIAVGALAGVIVLTAAVVRPRLITYLMVASIYAEAAAVEGVAIGRLVAPIALVAVAMQHLTATPRLRENRALIGAVTVYVLLALGSLAWTASLPGTMAGLASLGSGVIYLAGFAVLIRTISDLRRLLYAVAVCSTTLAVWWIFSYAAGVNRFANAAGDPNFLATFQVVALPMVLALASNERAGRRWQLHVAVGLIAISIVTTLSRGGFLTLLVALGLVVMMPSRALFRSSLQKVAFLVIAVVALGAIISVAGGDLRHRFETGFDQGTVAGSRGDLWRAALHAASEHPLVGLGFGAFRPASYELLRTTPGVRLDRHTLAALREGRYAHQAYLESLAELGPGGLALFVLILVLTGRSLVRTARRARSPNARLVRSTAMALVVGLVAFAAASLLLSTETSRGLWLIVGMAVALPTLSPRAWAGAQAGPPGGRIRYRTSPGPTTVIEGM
jgi:O-antigen ligase